MSTTTDAIRRRLDREYVVVLPPDELDVATVPAFAERLFAIGPNTDIVVDLRDLRFCGASGITLFLEVERHVTARGSSLTLSSPPPIFDRLLRLCGLDGHFTVRRPVNRKRLNGRGGADPSRR
jgi:anti-anti-sigma factor